MVAEWKDVWKDGWEDGWKEWMEGRKDGYLPTLGLDETELKCTVPLVLL